MERMVLERWRRATAILDRVLEAPAGERRALAAELCAGDEGLREEVEALLAAEAGSGGVLGDAPDAGIASLLDELAAGPAASADPTAGDLVGPYRLVRPIGEGGMGVVYLAERADGEFDQRVAVKLVKRGLDSAEVLARFRRERQILARLEHRAIARLLDGGIAADGRPYFAMEYVEGEPITVSCERRRSPIDERLRLVRGACEAVQYAHNNLVVHRDLKPSNILVTSSGDLKLLDFGIAKLLGPEGESEGKGPTRIGIRPLTPEYAAPEQVRGEPVSTATDVYALGVILFELLTGRRPYGATGGSRAELERAVLEAEPARPSTVVTRAAEGREPVASAAERGGLAPNALRRLLAGDLDAIVLKALRKEPERRYGSAQALGEDLERYLESRPVTARPEGRRYRARKFVRRHRAGMAATSIVALSLLAGLGATAWQARQKALAARKAEEVKEFLISIFQAADPVQAAGEQISLRQVLDRGAERVERELAAQPALQGELLTVLSGIYAELAVFDRAAALTDRAIAIHERLYGPESHQLATNLRQKAVVDAARGDAAAAELLARRALAIHRRALGEVHAEVAEDLDILSITVRERGRLAPSRLVQESLAIRRALYGDEHPAVAESIANLAVMLREQGRYEEAAAAYREALELRRRLQGEKHPDVALTLHNFAALQCFRGEYRNAAALAGEALDSFVRLYGEDHPLTLSARHNRATIQRLLGNFEAADAGFRSVLDSWRRTLGENHPDALRALVGLSASLRDQGDLQGAERILRQVDTSWRERMGADDATGPLIRRLLGGVLAELGRHEEAEVLLHQALARLRAAHGVHHPEVAKALHELGLLAWRRGELDDAERLLLQARAEQQSLLGATHPETLASQIALGEVLRARGRRAEAEQTLRQALDAARRVVPDGHPLVVRAAVALGRVLAERGDSAPAIELLRNAASQARALWGEESARTAEVTAALAASLAARGQEQAMESAAERR